MQVEQEQQQQGANGNVEASGSTSASGSGSVSKDVVGGGGKVFDGEGKEMTDGEFSQRLHAVMGGNLNTRRGNSRL